MGDRYLISGVQLGMLMAMAKENMYAKAYDYIKTVIIPRQFVWSSEHPLDKDVEKVRSLVKGSDSS